jgi:spore germination protein YaaH
MGAENKKIENTPPASASSKTIEAPKTEKTNNTSTTTVLAPKPALKAEAVKPAVSKPPVVSKTPTKPQTSKPAELKPVVVAPSTKPVEIAPEVKPAPVTSPAVNKIVLGYGTYYYSGDKSSYNSLVAYGSNIDELATHTYSIKSDGTLFIPDGSFPQAQVDYANSKGMKTLAAIRNEEGDKFSGPLASALLNSPEAKAKLIEEIYMTVKTKNFKGVNIDFEMLNAKDRDAYSNFIKEVSIKLRGEGYMVTIAVPAKTFDSAKAYWTYGYDYKALGAYADQVVLMTYDEHWQSGTPGAVASINWVQQVVNYATSVIPRQKVILGLASYGYDWRLSGGYAKSYSIQGAYNTAAKYGAEIQWDDISKVPYFTYTDDAGFERIVYFEDSTSISYKLNIVTKSNLGGVAIWRLGLEDAKYWTTIKAQIR